MGAGGIMMSTGVGAPAGGWIFVGGAALLTYDTIKGFKQADDFAVDVSKNLIEPHYEGLGELDKELEELGISRD